MYLKVPTQGSPNTELLAWTVQEFFLWQAERIALKESSAEHESVNTAGCGHLKMGSFKYCIDDIKF